MIRVKELRATDREGTYEISAFADTKEEVNAGGKFIGLPDGANIESGSSIYTAALDVGIMQSNGTWKWS